MTEDSLPRPSSGVVVQLQSLARTATVEVIPLRGIEDKITAAPADTTLTVTCSPKFGLARTVDHVAVARAAGYRVIPHLAAKTLGSKGELREVVKRLADIGVDDLYVIGGDGEAPNGPFYEAYDVLRELHDIDHSFTRIGVACYPEVHPHISTEALVDALCRKQLYANYMVSQLCFDPQALLDWIRLTREMGIELPLRIGLADPLQARKLVELALRIGVGSSVKFLTKQHGMIGNLLLGRAYEPGDLVGDLLAAPDVERLKIEGLHMFSFNQIDITVEWLARNR